MTSKKRILVVCPHPENVAPGQRLKYEQYFEYFRENGYEVVVSSFMTMAFWNIVYKKGFIIQKILWTLFGYLTRVFDLFRIPFYDGVYIFLWVTPFGPPIFESLFHMLNKKIIYDIDDMVFLGHASKANKIIAPLKGPSKMIFLMKKAKHVIVCTPKLDEFVKKYNDSTTDISSTINTDIYVPIDKYSNAKPLTLGWSGSHSTSKYLYLLENILTELRKEVEFNLLVIGDPSFKFKNMEVEAIAWNEQTEVQNLQRIDIGLYPLPDEEWVYGKSGLKALQYMALGIPTVATAIGTNFRIIKSGVDGFLVTEDKEWREKLLLLMENPELRKSLGKEARKSVENNYSVKANRYIYLNIIKSVTSK